MRNNQHEHPMIPDFTAPVSDPSGPNEISIDELASLCQQDDWLEQFIRDTEQNHLLSAPAHMQEETLERLEHRSALLDIQTLRRPSIPSGKESSKRMQLFRYSLRVSFAAAGAILFLFVTPTLFDSPGAVAYGRPLTEDASRWPSVHRVYESLPSADDFIQNDRPFRNTLRDTLQSVSDSIYDFSNELFNRR
ncbi:MAG: hypothetical protein Q4F29_12780 [Lachnospiraceae bacterium]|nr:hypothetical protein [Lachnospiraceae bacterium]